LQAADEDNIPFLASALTFDALLAAVPFILLLLIGLTHLAQAVTQGPEVDTLYLFHRFLPPHSGLPDNDPFGVIERLLTGITENRGKLSIYAAPAFLWFSTRLFAGIRTSLNDIYDVSVRPPRPQPIILVYLLAKLRDSIMVVGTVVLFLANTLLTTGLAVLQARGTASVPQLAFFVSTLGRLLGEFLAFAFSVSLFYVTYRHASVRRLPWRTALLASIFTAVLFEVAKRLYGLYLANFASFEAQGGDANLGAAVLFILWVYYTAIVFLLGAVVAETWELRKMQQRQRAILG
jgi:membrane protein